MAERKPRQNTATDAPKRGAGGKWLPGHSPNPGGRPKDAIEVRDLARAHTVKAIETLVQMCSSAKSEPARIAAAAALLDRGWGKPTQPLANDAENPLTQPMPVLNVVITRAEPEAREGTI